jgi:hypothetical protein
MNGSESPDTREQYWRAQVDASGVWQQSAGILQSQRAELSALWLLAAQIPAQGVVPSASRRAFGFVPVISASPDSGLTLYLPNRIQLRG